MKRADGIEEILNHSAWTFRYSSYLLKRPSILLDTYFYFTKEISFKYFYRILHFTFIWNFPLVKKKTSKKYRDLLVQQWSEVIRDHVQLEQPKKILITSNKTNFYFTSVLDSGLQIGHSVRLRDQSLLQSLILTGDASIRTYPSANSTWIY